MNELTGIIIDACIQVQRELGPSLREDIYKECLSIEIRRRGLQATREAPVDVRYRGRSIGKVIFIDLLVADTVVVEAKAASQLTGRDWAQTLSYVRLGEYTVGLLVNFHAFPLKNGIHRVVPPTLPSPSADRE